MKLVVVSAEDSVGVASLGGGPKLIDDPLADIEGLRGVPGRHGDGRLPTLSTLS